MSNFYNHLAEDSNNMSFWLPKIQGHIFDTFKIPKTVIVKVPEEIMELFFMEKEGMTPDEMMMKVMEWVRDDFVPKVTKEINGGMWFIKNGSFSNKFDFSTCKNIGSNLLRLTANIIDINYTSFMFETGGNTELVAREFINPVISADGKVGVPCIYNGMPLRSEVRVFFDFTHQQALYAVNYWDWDYCHNDISRDATDKIIYESYYPVLEERYKVLEKEIMKAANFGLFDAVDLEGIWSVDFMEEYPGGPLWLIDMAEGSRSAYYDVNRIYSIYEEKGWLKEED